MVRPNGTRMTKSGFIKTPKQMLADGDITENDVVYKPFTMPNGQKINVMVLKSTMEAQKKPFTTKPNSQAKATLQSPRTMPLRELKDLLDTQKIKPSFQEEKTITRGVEGSIGGQGKRSGGMVKGGMASISPYKEKRTVMNTKGLNLTRKQEDEIVEFRPKYGADDVAYDNYYLKARSAGYAHDSALDAALLLSA